MPDRQYYLSTPHHGRDPHQYRAHVETILTLAGIRTRRSALPGGEVETKWPRFTPRGSSPWRTRTPTTPGPDRVGRASAGPGLDALLPRRRARRTAGGLRLAPEGDRGAIGARRRRATRGLEGLGDVRRHRSALDLPRKGLPGRGVRLLRARAPRDGRAARALEAGPELDRRRRGRGAGPPLRRAPLHAPGEGQGLGDGEVDRRGVRAPDRCARLDRASTKAEAKAKVQGSTSAWVTPTAGGLVGTRGPARRPRWQRGRRRTLPPPAGGRGARQAGGPDCLVHAPTSSTR